jgi:hypothetical protein
MTTTEHHDLRIFPIALDGTRHFLAGERFSAIAHDIDDGWADLQAAARDLEKGEAEVSAATGAPFDLARLARDYLDDSRVDWRAAVRDDVVVESQAAAIRQRIGAFVNVAKGTLGDRANQWADAHEKAICDALHAQRAQVHARLKKLVQTAEDLKAAIPYSEALEQLAEFDEIRSLHVALIQVHAADRSTWWRGIDWVGNYEEAWPEFFLAAGIHVEDARGTTVLDREPLQAPWELEGPIERVRAIAAADLWTPTRHSFDAAKTRVDRSSLFARNKFTEEKRVRPRPAPNTDRDYDGGRKWLKYDDGSGLTQKSSTPTL